MTVPSRAAGNTERDPVVDATSDAARDAAAGAVKDPASDGASDATVDAAPSGSVAPVEPLPVRAFHDTPAGYRWEDVPVKQYKNEGSHFRDVTRQVLFSGQGDQSAELRYFEIEPGGHSTFERHDHTHAVLILRGAGRAIVGDRVEDVGAFDLVRVAPQTWHQFHAADDAPLGFLCLVACDRDRPTRPDADERAALLADPDLGHLIRL